MIKDRNSLEDPFYILKILFSDLKLERLSEMISKISFNGFKYNSVIDLAKRLKPSARGELEITDLNRCYLERDNLEARILGRGFAWLDTGTHEALVDASNFVNTIESQQGLKIGCLEEIALNKDWIGIEAIRDKANTYRKSSYGQYLNRLVENWGKTWT